MEIETVSTADLLAAWREATRAAELAERLAGIALAAANEADASAVGSDEIARLATEAAAASERAAERARTAATQALEMAERIRGGRLRDADDAVFRARAFEDEARQRYHRAEQNARPPDSATPAGEESR